MFLSLIDQPVLAGLEPRKDGRVGAFAVQPDFPVSLENHRHPFPNVVKVQDAEQVIVLLVPVEGQGDAVRRPLSEHKPKTGGKKKRITSSDHLFMMHLSVPEFSDQCLKIFTSKEGKFY